MKKFIFELSSIIDIVLVGVTIYVFSEKKENLSLNYLQYPLLSAALRWAVWCLCSRAASTGSKTRVSFVSPVGQEYPFLQVSEIFLSRSAVSA